MAGVVAAAVGVPLLCGTLAAAVLTGAGGFGGCGPPAAATPSTVAPRIPAAAGGFPAVAGWDPDQVGNAATILAVGAALRIPVYGQVIAVAVAMQESSLRDLPGGDRDSVGLFQQRPSQGWGTPAQLHDPAVAAGRFYTALQHVPGWQRMPLTDAAQAVQRSAYPDAYAKWQPAATALTLALTGTAPGTGTCAGGWVVPVKAPVGSGFRTPDRPGHNGVDLLAARGTPVRAAAVGTVATVACQAVDTATGGPWGCNRDGDAARTAGCDLLTAPSDRLGSSWAGTVEGGVLYGYTGAVDGGLGRVAPAGRGCGDGLAGVAVRGGGRGRWRGGAGERVSARPGAQ